MDDELVKMLTRTNVPFKFVEDPFFKKTVSKAYPDYHLKGRQFYASSALPQLCGRIINNLTSDVAENYYAITIDGWAAKNNPTPSFYR